MTLQTEPDFETELRAQVDQLAQRVRGREAVLLPAGTAGELLLDGMAHAFGDAVVVRVPDQLDRTGYVILTAAGQCGDAVVERVAQRLAASPSEPAHALDALGEALGERQLFVTDLDRLGAGALFELPAVFARQAMETREWFEARLAGGTMRHARTAHEASARALLDRVRPVSRDPVGAYRRARFLRDVLGVSGQEAELSDDVIREVAGPEAYAVLELLVLHGRPIDAALLRDTRLVTSGQLEAARSSGLVRVAWGLLESSPELIGLITPRGEVRMRQQLADALARVARDGGPRAPAATLEAHRHYTLLGDLRAAAHFARFGVQLLLDMGRQASLHHEWQDAIRAYGSVLDLDTQARAADDGSAVPAHARSYAVHYQAYNRYKAGASTELLETLSAYREALTAWPENALFWSRTVACAYLAGRYADGYRALDDAFAAVPEHSRRMDYLVRRTTARLLDRRLLLPAWLVWRDHQPVTPLERGVRERMLELSQSGFPTRHLWGPGGRDLWLEDPLRLSVVEINGGYRAQAAGVVAEAASPQLCFAGLTTAMLDALRAWLEAPEPAGRRPAFRLDGQSLNGESQGEDEGLRWLMYLERLHEQVERGEIPAAQRTAVLGAWAELRLRAPGLRHPLTGCHEDGTLYWSWKYCDVPATSLSVEIDAEGELEWFYRHEAESAAAMAPVASLPQAVLGALSRLSR